MQGIIGAAIAVITVFLSSLTIIGKALFSEIKEDEKWKKSATTRTEKKESR